MLSQRHMELLEKRGISSETADRLGWKSINAMLAIPYNQAGKEVGIKYRTLEGDKKFFQEKGSEQIFYNWDALRENTQEKIIICEGEMDCAIALQCGFLAVSVPNGAPSKPVDVGDLKYAYLVDLPKDREIIIASDNDNAGAHLLHDLSIRIGQHRCKWLRYPQGCKDLNDVFMLGGSKLVVDTINKALWCKIDGVYSMSEFPELPEMEAFPCPISSTEGLFSLRGGDLSVFTGIPGYGKTTLINHICGGMALKHNWNIGIASFEQSPQIDHKRALRTYYHSKLVRDMSDRERAEADDWIERKFVFISPSLEDETNLAWVIKKIEAIILRNNCQLIVIDPWNEMDHDYPPGMTLTQYTGFAIKQFKKLARRYLVHIIIVAHPAKMQRAKNTSEYPIPSLYDISDSAHFINKPDVGIVIHRNEDGSMLFRVLKCRYIGIIGNLGETKLLFSRDNNTLTPIY